MNTEMHYFLSNRVLKNEDLDMARDMLEEHTLKYHISKDQLFSCIHIFSQIFLNKAHLKVYLHSNIH